MTNLTAIRHIEPASYVAHPLHRCERSWPESNCYIDVWIEVLHAVGLEPLACAPFTVSADFEGDQWTFFKPPHGDLTRLYGVRVDELTTWRPLIHHVVEHLGQRRMVLTEADAFFLPDTVGTDYRRQHTKTTIAIQEIDVEARRLGYFHNAGYFTLEGADFADLFKLDRELDTAALPLFAELAKLDRIQALPAPKLLEKSLELLAFHLEQRPPTNPISRYIPRFATDLEWLKQEGLPTYHVYAFASLRQLGSAFELTGAYLRWLGEQGVGELEPAAAACDLISSSAKAMILKGARAVNARRDVDFSPTLTEMAAAWEQVMHHLVPRFGG